MLKRSKLIAALVAIVLIVATLASCGGKTTGGSNKRVELTVWNTQGTDFVFKELAENIPEKWLTEKTNVSVQNIYGNDGGQWDSKLTKLVAGNNLPNIIWCQAAQGPSHFNKMKELNKLWLLTDDMLKKYAPNIWKRTPSYIWDQFRTEDGKILGIPFDINTSDIDTVYYDYTDEQKERLLNIKNVPASSIMNTLSIRDDVLKKIYPEAKSYDEIIKILDEKKAPIGDELVDVPIKSSQEFIDFMYKIRDLNLTENGKKVYAFGYGGDGNDNWEAICYLGNMMYGGGNHQYTAHWNDKTESIEIPLMTEYVKQIAKTQNQMILDKVIDPESLAHTGAQFQAKVFQGQYAICSATKAGSFDTINKQIKESGKNFQYRPLFIDIPSPEGYAPYSVMNVFSSSFCILNTLSEEDMIQVLKWADLQYTDEFMEIYNWGTKEQGLYTEEGGKRQYVDPAFNAFFINGDSSALETVNTKGLAGQGGRFYIRPMASSRWTPDVYNNKERLTPTVSTGFKFPAESKYVTSVKAAPPCYAYASQFGNIQEVVDYWARREEWEIAIKKAFAAADGQFEAKWNEMKAIVTDIVDVKEMEKKMTEIALPYWETIKKNQAK